MMSKVEFPELSKFMGLVVWIQLKPQKVQIVATEDSRSTDASSETSAVVQVMITSRDSQTCHGILSWNDRGCASKLTFQFNWCVSAVLVILWQLVSSVFAVKKLIGLWERWVLVKQLALLMSALLVPQLMASATLHVFSIARNVEVDLHPSHTRVCS